MANGRVCMSSHEVGGVVALCPLGLDVSWCKALELLIALGVRTHQARRKEHTEGRQSPVWWHVQVSDLALGSPG